MLTPTEMSKLLAQINEAFTEDRERLKRLELKVASLDIKLSEKPAKGAAKNVE